MLRRRLTVRPGVVVRVRAWAISRVAYITCIRGPWLLFLSCVYIRERLEALTQGPASQEEIDGTSCSW